MSRGGEDVLFKCLPPGTEPRAGRFPGPVHARGKWFALDIHCHARCEKAAVMVEGNSAVSQWFLETSASERSREINRQNGIRTRLQGSSAEKRIEDMDRMGIDIQAISPAPRQTYYGADHVMMGTDYPADMGEVDPIGFIEGACGLDDSERRAILGGNAARLLNIEIPRRPA